MIQGARFLNVLLFFEGFGAGSSSHSTTHAGGGAGYLCMPPKPEYNKFDKSNDSLAYSWVRVTDIAETCLENYSLTYSYR